jgi:hypothetical protein
VTGPPAEEPDADEAEVAPSEGEDTELDEEIAESFPASDPPSHWSGVSGEGPTVGGRNGTAPLPISGTP